MSNNNGFNEPDDARLEQEIPEGDAVERALVPDVEGAAAHEVAGADEASGRGEGVGAWSPPGAW